MSNLDATCAGTRLLAKTIAGWPFRAGVARTWAFSESQFWQYQLQSFLRIYDFARQHVPYYKSRGGQYPPITHRAGSILEVLSQLPVLSKATVREHNREFWPVRPALPTWQHTTSGTTGTPLRLRANLAEKGLAQAVYEAWLRRITGQRLPKSLHLSGFMTPQCGSELFWKDYLLGHVYLSIYSLSQPNRQAVTDLIDRLQPRVISGYASAVDELATLVADRLRSTRESRLAVVTSEVLQPRMRDNIQSSLCARVYDNYGSQEGSHRVLECQRGAMHIHPMVGVVEIVDEQHKLVDAGQVGKVLVTGLLRQSMPLFRYDIGDAARSTGYNTRCSCGLAWPTIGPVQGRSEDLVRTRDGRRVGYLNFHATKNLSGIVESQLVQVGYQRFVFNLVAERGVDHTTIESHITDEVQRRLGTAAAIEFRYLAAVPREARGKFRAVVVSLADDE